MGTIYVFIFEWTHNKFAIDQISLHTLDHLTFCS